MIQDVTGRLIVNTDIPETISFVSRSNYLRSLPNFLSVILEARDGMDLVNISCEEPQIQNRDKPWFKTDAYGLPLGLYVWNSSQEEWVDISPADTEKMMSDMQKAVEMSNAALEGSENARDTAETAEDHAGEASTLIGTQVTNSNTFYNTALAGLTTTRSDAPSFLNGHSSVAPATDGDFAIDPDDPRVDYAPGWVVTPWVTLANPLDAGFPIHGFSTLIQDSHPALLFSCELQCNATGDAIRLRGYEIWPIDSYLGTTRVVQYMWLLKGILA